MGSVARNALFVEVGGMEACRFFSALDIVTSLHFILWVATIMEVEDAGKVFIPLADHKGYRTISAGYSSLAFSLSNTVKSLVHYSVSLCHTHAPHKKPERKTQK